MQERINPLKALSTGVEDHPIRDMHILVYSLVTTIIGITLIIENHHRTEGSIAVAGTIIAVLALVYSSYKDGKEKLLERIPRNG